MQCDTTCGGPVMIRLVCRACGKRLKLPDDMKSKRSAKCPKCLEPVDLTSALEAAAYTSAVAAPGMAGVPPSGNSGDTHSQITETQAKPAPSHTPRSAALIGEDDPLPYDPLPLPAEKNEKHEQERDKDAGGSHPPLPPGTKSLVPDWLDDANLGSVRSPLPKAPPPPSGEPALSLDDDSEPADLPPELAPFRVPVHVLADSARTIGGECFAVIVPHGVFLEREPMKPFLYIPIGSGVDSPASNELTVLLPDRRAVTILFKGRSGRTLARDTRSFLVGMRLAPVPADYRLKWWMLLPAFIFATGLASGPLVLSQVADLGWGFGLLVGVGFVFLGLIANVIVVLLSRHGAFFQTAMMAGMCLLVTGIFLFGATAYLAGWQKAKEEIQNTPQPPGGSPGSPNPSPKPPDPKRPLGDPDRPTHLDRAKKNGSSALEDGPADVTALTLAADYNTLGIGYADGTTRLWPLDQPTFEAMQPGPKPDGPVLRMQFDHKTSYVFAHTASGVTPAPRGGPPTVATKIPGTPVAIAPELDEDRIRFAAIRGNAIQYRLLPTAFLINPPVKGRGVSPVIPNPKTDEIVPMGSRDPIKPPTVTFLAWGSENRLFVGQPNGGISIFDAMMRPEGQNNDHKAAVKTWALYSSNGNFATGDEKGGVALWSARGGKPTLWPVFDGAPVTGLAFNATGSRLAITDNTGWLVIWDATAGKALHRVKRPAHVKAVTYGPTDDIMILAAGRTVEVWWVPELVK